MEACALTRREEYVNAEPQNVKPKTPREIIDDLSAALAGLPDDLDEDLLWYLQRELQAASYRFKRRYLNAYSENRRLA